MENREKYIAEITDRYIYDVTRRLPVSQRADIDRELRSLIDDMLVKKAAEKTPEKKDIDVILLELGRPSDLADKYKGTKRFLIGPDLYDVYVMILKIVLPVAVFGVMLATIIGYFVSPPKDLLRSFGDLIASLFAALFQAFGWITVIFITMQRFSRGKEFPEEKQWKPSDLPSVPAEKIRIKRIEPVLGIVFSILFIILFNFAPQLMGIYVFTGSHDTVPLFNMPVLEDMLIFINLIIFLGLLAEIAKFVFGRYTIRLACLITVFNIISIGMVLFVFASPEIWNAGFMNMIQNVDNGVISDFMNKFPMIIAGMIVFGYVLDTATTLYKSLRYRAAGALNNDKASHSLFIADTRHLFMI